MSRRSARLQQKATPSSRFTQKPASDVKIPSSMAPCPVPDTKVPSSTPCPVKTRVPFSHFETAEWRRRRELHYPPSSLDRWVMEKWTISTSLLPTRPNYGMVCCVIRADHIVVSLSHIFLPFNVR